MPTYISLIRYTQQGIQHIKESPKRLEAAKKALRDAGAELKELYLVMGQYDAVSISEAPDDETLARVVLALGSKGNVQTETLRAFREEEYRKIVSALR
jgi:uncharacterized protein with GYD domain